MREIIPQAATIMAQSMPADDFTALPDRTPILIGAGAVCERGDDPAAADEPLALMRRAAQLAEADAGCAALAEVGEILVPRGFWSYADPARRLAAELGCARARSCMAEIGVLQQALFDEACAAIAAGDVEAALVVGGEARHRERLAAKLGVEAPTSDLGDALPDRVLKPSRSFAPEQEGERGLMLPVAGYALIESALRRAEKLTPQAHRDEVARLWAGMSRVAADNPLAWRREALDAATIRDQGMLAFPYTRWHASEWNVDQAAALIFCSARLARRLGATPRKWLFPHAAAQCNAMTPLSLRPEPHRYPDLKRAGAALADAAGFALRDCEFIDLYSCFPAAVRAQARELNLDLDAEAPPTATGGMSFGGGPLNNYTFQALAALAEKLRRAPDATALLSSVSGILHKQGLGLWSSRPPPEPWRMLDIDGEVEALPPRWDYEGGAEIVGCTVLHQKGEAEVAVALCDVDGGGRDIARSRDAAVMRRMMDEECLGRRVLIDAEANFVWAD